MQKTIMNISDQTLYEVLGAELKDSAVIDARMRQAYEIIREKSRTKNNGTNNGLTENEKPKTAKIRKKDIARRKNGNTAWRKMLITLGSIAAVLCVTFIFCVMNPVMAREIPILGSIFGRIADVYSFGKLPEEGTVKLPAEEDTEPMQSEAVDPKEGMVSAGNGDISSENNLTSSDGGITISITEEYVSNQAAYIGVKVESEQAFPEMVALIESGQQFIKARTTEEYSFNPEPRRNRRYIEGKFVNEHTFLGIIRIDYDDIRRAIEETGAQDKDVQIPEAFTIELEISEIASTLKDVEKPAEFDISDEEFEQMTEEEQMAYMDSIPKAWYGIEYESWHRAGTWHFTLPIRMTDENARTIEVGQYDEDGIGVDSIEISSMEMKINTVMSEEASLYIVVFDADGRPIETSNSSNAGFTRLIDGHNISEVTVYLCDLPAYFELKELRQGTELTKEEVGQIARYQVIVPISE